MSSQNSHIYQTKTWRALRIKILKRDKGLCQTCLKAGRYTPGNQIDHRTPLRDNDSNPYDENNLQVLCLPCHRLKSAEETSQAALKKKLETIDSFIF